MGFKIKDLDNRLKYTIDNVGNSFGLVLLKEQEKDYQVWSQTGYFHIPFLKVNIHRVFVMKYSEEQQAYYLKESGYHIYNPDTRKFLFFDMGVELVDCIKHYMEVVLKAEIDMTILNEMTFYFFLDRDIHHHYQF